MSTAPANSNGSSTRPKIVLCRETRSHGGWMIWECRGENKVLLEKGSRLRQIWPEARRRAFQPGARFDLIETNRPQEVALECVWTPQFLGCPAGAPDSDLWCLLDMGANAGFIQWMALKDRGNLHEELRRLDQDGILDEASRTIPETVYTWDLTGTAISASLRQLIAEQAEKDAKLKALQEQEQRKREATGDPWQEWQSAYRK